MRSVYRSVEQVAYGRVAQVDTELCRRRSKLGYWPQAEVAASIANVGFAVGSGRTHSAPQQAEGCPERSFDVTAHATIG